MRRAVGVPTPMTKREKKMASKTKRLGSGLAENPAPFTLCGQGGQFPPRMRCQHNRSHLGRSAAHFLD